ncbi:MAG: cytochrome C oxidase subunit IV family protein [Acidimicrobiaceae bacterium]|nr:cytochrome C oxidase subunit IV family protein [Acidimicrobiaceae bacterium]MYE97352.1 cytochrome C oxidase subunit IV family protein [Acidimicrobiaceae bacterium]MYI52501.1 cytochrome C oxidase subunit IV family protein [Acidimicrobiaceae bacterium]
MSDTATSEHPEHSEPEAAEHHDEHHGEGHAHPSDWAYVKIAVVLAAITALEVFTYFESVVDWGVALVPSLIFMMVVKFYLVATWFMHLRFDSKLFGRMFTAGLVLAAGVYLVTLTVFEFWV